MAVDAIGAGHVLATGQPPDAGRPCRRRRGGACTRPAGRRGSHGRQRGSGYRVDYINDFALRLTGWTREEVIGSDWWDMFATPERREEARVRYRGIVAGRVVMEHERESAILTKAGEVRLIRWSHVTRRDADGSVAGVAESGRGRHRDRGGPGPGPTRGRAPIQAGRQLPSTNGRHGPGPDRPAVESGCHGNARLDRSRGTGQVHTGRRVRQRQVGRRPHVRASP